MTSPFGIAGGLFLDERLVAIEIHSGMPSMARLRLFIVSATRVFIARLAGCGVFDPAGDRVGKVIDVLVSYR